MLLFRFRSTASIPDPQKGIAAPGSPFSGAEKNVERYSQSLRHSSLLLCGPPHNPSRPTLRVTSFGNAAANEISVAEPKKPCVLGETVEPRSEWVIIHLPQ